MYLANWFCQEPSQKGSALGFRVRESSDARNSLQLLATKPKEKCHFPRQSSRESSTV